MHSDSSSTIQPDASSRDMPKPDSISSPPRDDASLKTPDHRIETARAVNRVNIFSNDPNAKGLGLEQVEIPEGESHFAIPGWSGTGDLFNPGTPEFEASALYVVLNRTYAMWSDFFSAPFTWQPGVGQLPVDPRAGEDFNAYYDRKGLKFFFGIDVKTGQTIYACESSDVSAHECGHAVLDAHHPDYWDSLLSETGAFHESFGDMSAMLLTLHHPKVRAAMLAENAGDLSKSNVVSRLAEQLARGLFDSGYADAVDSPDALRDAVNHFKYRSPNTLPGRAPASRLSSESHSFSRVFTGAFYDLLMNIYHQLRKENASLSPDAALAQTRNDVGRLLAEGLALAPKGDATFKTIAASMFMASAHNFSGKYFNALRKAFVGRRILKATEANKFKSTRGVGLARTSALGTTRVEIETPASLESANVRTDAELPARVRVSLRAPKKDFRLVAEQPRPGGRRVLDYRVAREMELKGAGLGVARGATVTLWDSIAVHVAPDGRMISAQHQRTDRAHEKRIRDHVAKLVARGRVYAAPEGERVDPSTLIARKQPYYIAYDPDGKKRIHRAFIACCM